MRTEAASRSREQLPAWAKITLVAIAIPLFLAALALIPIVPVQPYLDFQVLYQTDMGLLRGIPVYDYAAQVQMIAQLARVTPQQVHILPFPYPPWYALITAWLAWLPIDAAARIWFGINLLLLFGSIILLTQGWPLLKRVAAFGLGFFFLPVLGSLLVGQYGFPLLFGAALMSYALRNEKPLLAALAAVLLTFKPHLGALILLAVWIYLWQRKDAFGRRAMRYMLIAGVVLFLVGFFADPAWPVSYTRSLSGFQSDSGVASCDLCAGLPAILGNSLDRAKGLQIAFAVSAVIFLALLFLWAWKRRETVRHPDALLSVAGLIVLLASPYLLNYDFLLLLVPMAVLAGEKQGIGAWVLLGLAYLLPFPAVWLLSRSGNLVFSLSAIILMSMLYWTSDAVHSPTTSNA